MSGYRCVEQVKKYDPTSENPLLKMNGALKPLFKLNYKLSFTANSVNCAGARMLSFRNWPETAIGFDITRQLHGPLLYIVAPN